MLDLAVLFGSPDSTLHVQTDVPARLALMFTTSEPTAIPRNEKVRGVWKRKGTTWAIQPGAWYWQNEDGDTTEHSWTITGWPPGLALWYYFDALQQGHGTVSKSILLNSVRPEIGPATQGKTEPLPRLASALPRNIESPLTPFPSVL